MKLHLSWPLKALVVYSGCVASAWLYFNVRMSLHDEPLEAPCDVWPIFAWICPAIEEFFDEVLLTLVLFLSLFSFAPQIFSLAVALLFTTFADSTGGRVVCRAAAFAASFCFGPLSFGILNTLQTYQGLSNDEGTLHHGLCLDDKSDSDWCHFMETTARLSLCLLGAQCAVTLYNMVLFAHELCTAAPTGRRVAASHVVIALALVAGAGGYAAWSAGSVGVYMTRTLNMDFIRLLMSPFLLISIFLALTSGIMVVFETSREMTLIAFAAGALGSFGLSGGIVFHFRRLTNENYALFGETPCATLNPLLGGSSPPHDVCKYETIIVYGLAVMLGSCVLLMLATLAMLVARKEWETLTFGSGDSDGGTPEGHRSRVNSVDGYSRPLLRPVEYSSVGTA